MNELFTTKCAMVQCPKCGSGLLDSVYRPPVFDAVEGTVTQAYLCRNCAYEYEIVFVAREYRRAKHVTAKQRVTVLDWKTSYLLPEAEAKIGPDWYIFNAPRPLPGHVTWTADFLHGVFYAAINPHEKNAVWLAEQCISLDGWVIVFVDKEQIYREVQAHYDTHFPDSGIKVANYSLQAVFGRYLDVVAEDSIRLHFND